MASPSSAGAGAAAGATAEGVRALLVALRALKLGAAYAIKVRLPHALVMTALFGDAAARQPGALWRRAAGLAWEHGRALAVFAAAYKLLIGAGRGAYAAAGVAVPDRPGAPAAPWHALAAGAVAARLVWAGYSHLGYNLLLYLLSRLAVGAARHAAKRGVPPFAAFKFGDVYPALAVATWAATMYLYESDPGALHPSLVSSMNEIYRCVRAGRSPPRSGSGLWRHAPRPRVGNRSRARPSLCVAPSPSHRRAGPRTCPPRVSARTCRPPRPHLWRGGSCGRRRRRRRVKAAAAARCCARCGAPAAGGDFPRGNVDSDSRPLLFVRTGSGFADRKCDVSAAASPRRRQRSARVRVDRRERSTARRMLNEQTSRYRCNP